MTPTILNCTLSTSIQLDTKMLTAESTTTRRPFPWHCPKCREPRVTATTIHHVAEVAHDGRHYSLEIPKLEAARCEACGEIVFDDRADQQISAALRKEIGLLSPAQIRTALDELGMQQRELAGALGVAEATISRWCTGSVIQTRAMDNFLRLFFTMPDARDILLREGRNPDFGTQAVLGDCAKDAPNVGTTAGRALRSIQLDRPDVGS